MHIKYYHKISILFCIIIIAYFLIYINLIDNFIVIVYKDKIRKEENILRIALFYSGYSSHNMFYYIYFPIMKLRKQEICYTNNINEYAYLVMQDNKF
jgi:hypothetical protein